MSDFTATIMAVNLPGTDNIAVGETGSITVKIKNTNTISSLAIRKVYLRVEKSATGAFYTRYPAVATVSTNISKGSTVTLTIPLSLSAMIEGTFPLDTAHCLERSLLLPDPPCIMVNPEFGDGSEWGHVGDQLLYSASIPEVIKIVDMRYVPSIPVFLAERTPNPDSTGAAVDIACTLAEGADPAYSGLALTLQWKEEDAETFPAANTLAVTVADALAAGGTTVTPDFTFEASKAYTLRATFTDGIDSAVSETKLSKAFKVINVHPTSKNIGLGQFAVADLDADDVMRMDTVYRPYFHEGARDADGREIIGKTDYSATAVDTGIKWLNGRKIYRKTFIFGSMAASGSLDIPIGEEAIEEVVHLRGGVPTAGGAGFELLPFTHQATLNYQKGLTVGSLASNPVIQIRMGSGSTAPVGGYVVIEYVPIDPATQWSKLYMTAASESGCVVSASSSDGTGYVALKGFSLAPTEYWVSTLADPDRWIQMQMPGGRTNIVLYICNHNTAATYPGVKAGTFYGSNDGSTWDALGTFNNRPDRQNFALTVHFLRNQTPYSYIRIKITSPGANVDKARIGRISVFGDIA